MKEFILKHKTYGIIIGAFIIVLCAILLIFRGTAQPSSTNVKLGGSSVDFEDEANQYHTAADGVGIISSGIVLDTERLTYSDPEEAWTVADTLESYNHFTFPEAAKMDDESIGILTIPDIGLSVRVYESESQMEDMEHGVAHFKSTSAWAGTIGLSAHNVNFNGTDGYFKNVYQLKPGASLTYETALGTRQYVVESSKTIAKDDWSELGRTEDNRIVLITCISGQPNQRLCVVAVEK